MIKVLLIDTKVLEEERKEIERLYYEVKLACVKGRVLPLGDDEIFMDFIVDKFDYNIEKWMIEFFRVAGYIHMIDMSRTGNAYMSVMRAIRLGYTVQQFLYDLISDWESFRKQNDAYSITIRSELGF